LVGLTCSENAQLCIPYGRIPICFSQWLWRAESGVVEKLSNHGLQIDGVDLSTDISEACCEVDISGRSPATTNDSASGIESKCVRRPKMRRWVVGVVRPEAKQNAKASNFESKSYSVEKRKPKLSWTENNSIGEILIPVLPRIQLQYAPMTECYDRDGIRCGDRAGGKNGTDTFVGSSGSTSVSKTQCVFATLTKKTMP
jgi:hypothetical protein